MGQGIEPIRSQSMQKVCGTLEVAGDLVARSGVLYAVTADDPDPSVIELLTHATALLARAAEALREGVAVHSGPAA